MSPPPAGHTALERSDRERELADNHFWLSKLDEDLPRASVVADFTRAASGRHRYQDLAFALDPQVVRVLKSLDKTRGVSDLALCATLLAVLLAKYHREDELVVGLQTDGALGERAVVPLRVACASANTVVTAMRAIADEITAVYERPSYSAARMAQVLGVPLSEHRSPFFNIALAVEEGDAAFDFAAYPVDIAFLFDTSGGYLRGHIAYAADVYSTATIERVVVHFQNGAASIAAQPNARLADLDILAPDERARIVEEFAGRTAAYPLDRTLHGLFEEQAKRTPNAIAAIHNDAQLTYAELNARANRIAHTLLGLGLKQGDFVGILLQRSCDFLAAMLGVFKAGGAYVPLDPTYPRDRILYMLEDSEAGVVISDAPLIEAFRDVLAGAGRTRVVLALSGNVDAAQAKGLAATLVAPDELAAAPKHDPQLALAGGDRAYMIYTSGSTGRPKGAICRHDGALNHLYGELDGLGIKGAFRFLQTAASSSDISVWQFMAPVLFGGATVIADYEVVVDPAQLFALIKRHRVTLAEPVPVVLRALINHIAELPAAARALPDLVCMMATGEALAGELVDQWLALYPQIPIANTYGPTETSDDVTLLVLRAPPAPRRAVVPIGRPLPNLALFVLDRDLRPVPIGVPGEICIAGIGVGEGYWRQPEKTAAAFVPCPFPQRATGAMYRTGDLGRWLPDGTIEFLGRIDQQVKVRGFRVEPGEIEAVMTQHAAIEDAAVVAMADGSGTRRLVGYYVVHKGQSLATAELRQFLKGALAEHMVPAVLVPLSALPLTPLGKVDRKALERIDYLETGARDDGYVAPRSDTERMLAAAWSTVLGQREVGVHDNFFEIGGDSMMTIQVIAALKKNGLAVTPKELFVHPTIAELAAHVEAAKRAVAMPVAGGAAPQWDLAALRQQLAAVFPDLADVYPLSATQRGIYFQSILPSKSSGAYIEQIGFDLAGDLDVGAFANAWQHVVNATEVLRTAIVRKGTPQPVQVVLRSAMLAPVIQDWRQLSAADRDAALAALVRDERKAGFNLGRPPLMRVNLVRLADKVWHVLWTYHHVILDGWSEPLVLGDVFEAYGALVKGQPAPAPAAARYRDFVAWSESQDLTRAQAFWRAQLAGFTSPVSIKDPSPAVAPAANIELSHASHEVLLSAAETSRLEEVARRNRLTLSTLIHGAWAILLHRRTAAPDVVVGAVTSGRQCELPQIESVRGVVVVTQPLRTRVVADATVASWLRLLQLQMAELREYEHTPLALIQQWCDVPPEKRPLFDTLVVMANYVGSDLTKASPPGLELANVSYVTQPLYALTLFVVGGAQMSVRLVYERRRYAHATVVQLLEEYRQLLLRIAENPEQRLASTLAAH
jgi:amino acid adenylation domain-containing protein